MSRRGRSRRALAALIALSAAALGTALAGYATATPRVWVADLSWTLAAVVALAGVAAAAHRSERRSRTAWRLLLAGCVAWLLAQLYWDAFVATSIPASPNPADLLWMAFAVAGAAGVHRMGAGTERERTTSWLEVAPIIVAVCTLLGALLWNHVAHSHLSVLGQATALAYPMLYVSAALVMIQAVVAEALDVRANPGLGALLAGLVLEAAGFILWSPTLLGANYVVGANAVDGLWTAGLLLMGLGAFCAGPVRAARPACGAERDRGGVLPGATFGALAASQAALIVTGAPAGALLLLSFGLAIVGCVLLARGAVLRREQASLYEQVRERERALSRLNQRLGEESRRDPLTGLGNRLRLSEDMRELDARTLRYEHGYCLVLCDLDRFKAYNDCRGHQAGDDVLRQVARLLEDNARSGDRVYRYGGEELLLVLPEQDEEAGRIAAEHHRRALEQAAIPHPMNTPDVVTLSAGVAAAALFETPEEVLRRADRALYEAKRAGRNRVCVAGPLVL
ncbi:MAG: diguanylate cyclase domain-containing protein [Solirubrobacteraceae bacterium]